MIKRNRIVLMGYDEETNQKLGEMLVKLLPDWIINWENEVQNYLDKKVEKYSPFGLNLLYNVESDLNRQIVIAQKTENLINKNKQIFITTEEREHFWNILKDILFEQNTRTEVFCWNNNQAPRLRDLASQIARELTKQTPVCVYLDVNKEFDYPIVKLMNP